MKIGINNVDPLRVYLVRDLYRLYSSDPNLRLRNDLQRSLLDNYVFSSKKLDVFLAKPLVHCNVRELKLALLFHYMMQGVSSVIDRSNFSMMKEYGRVHDGEIVTQCFLNNLDYEYCDYTRDPKTILSLENHRSVWYELVRSGDLSILDKYEIVEITSLGYHHITETLGRNRTFNTTIGIVEDTKLKKSYSTTLKKRPFTKVTEYPILEKDSATMRFRDMISKFDSSRYNGLFRGINSKLKFMKLSKDELVLLLNKPIDLVTQADVDLIYNMSRNSGLSYSLRSLDFHLKRPYFKEKGLVFPFENEKKKSTQTC